MRDLNKVLLIGRVGRKPEGRTTGKGQRLAVFPLATARRSAKVRAVGAAGASGAGAAAGAVAAGAAGGGAGGGGAKAAETDWHQVVAWGVLARICEDYLRVGQEVFIEGTVHNSSYTYTDEHGVKHVRKTSEVYADNVRFLGGVGARSGGGETGESVTSGGAAGAIASEAAVAGESEAVASEASETGEAAEVTAAAGDVGDDGSAGGVAEADVGAA